MNNNLCRIGFLGSDEIALPLLNNLRRMEGFSLVAVLTQPDRPSGRGRKVKPNPIKSWAMQHGCEVRDPVKPSSEEVSWFASLQIDLLLVMAYGHILKQDMLDVAPLGCYNFHASLLPAYRGASPIETALAMGEKKSGVTLMRVISRMDAGPILDHQTVQITKLCNGPILRSKIAEACVPLMEKNLPLIRENEMQESEQDETKASYCRKLKKSDGQLNFSLPAEILDNQVRAFSSWPGSFFDFEGQRLRIGESRCCIHHTCSPGKVFKSKDDRLLIGTSSCCLEIIQIQKPGGKMLPTADFLRGFQIPEGSQLKIYSSTSLTR